MLDKRVPAPPTQSNFRESFPVVCFVILHIIIYLNDIKIPGVKSQSMPFLAVVNISTVKSYFSDMRNVSLQQF